MTTLSFREAQTVEDLADLLYGFLPVNLGSLGFLTDIPLPDLYKALESVLSGDYTIESRTREEAELQPEDRHRGGHGDGDRDQDAQLGLDRAQRVQRADHGVASSA